MESSKIFTLFDQITKIPRESGNEAQIIQYLIDFAKERNLEYKTDSAGNVVIKKAATKGMESAPVVVLQSHSDMVCEKNSGSSFDFNNEPIVYTEEDGWLIAKETTLGADCGIGMAAQLAILDSDDVEHGPVEALFTTEEETGLTGAKSLEPGFITGDILINLDSEDEGELFIGCAGGIDTTARFNYKIGNSDPGSRFYKVSVFGATGGHSGDDIHKNRANANQILFRYLYQLSTEVKFNISLLDGGNKRNAIAREAYAVIALKSEDIDIAGKLFAQLIKEVIEEHPVSDPELNGKFEEHPYVDTFIEDRVAGNLIKVLNGIPHGVLAMSQDIPGLVETSTNLASVKMERPGVIKVGTSQRSSLNSARYNASKRVESLFLLAGADVTHESEYPGWKPRVDSPLLEKSRKAYLDLFGYEPVVRAIHAGLECGMFLDKFPKLDMISFGPTIRGAHAPGEKLEIASVEKFRKLLLELLSRLK
ncbi:MAG: aminoacyl-histidine dipeptidase [Bacteroidales bacterium]